MKRNHKRPPFKTLSDSKELIVESLRLPKDTMLGAAIVTITGNREAFIENYKGILEYTTQTIVLQGKNCKICFEGKQLSIEYYTNEDMKISGMIDTVRYFFFCWYHASLDTVFQRLCDHKGMGIFCRAAFESMRKPRYFSMEH